MRTPGHDFELAAGFLLTEGVVTSASQIERQSAVAAARTAVAQKRRHRGTAAGRRRRSRPAEAALLHVLQLRRLRQNIPRRRARLVLASPVAGPVLDPAIVHRLPDALRAAQAVFDRTGGLHASALFDSMAICSAYTKTWAGTTPSTS